eukprot:CAMPEP_0177640034 /NCGR_PEP_ID=MMETSP0447-20121125/6333_1 /TAXON_ID=0 /ORGANISM="Stygamoeba regulata, Strain BSH-02190019" /LENGTH=219 /DNA_ID=CAMNT_0019142089 /DNA_START=255 /DNA_END=914 /DNA_ORIENTATION=-
MKKYEELYRKRGIDTLTLYPGISHILMPSHALRMANTLLETLRREEHANRPTFVHAFSVGGFIVGNLLSALEESSSHRVDSVDWRGHVYDSVVDFEGVPKGLGLATSQSVGQPWLAKPIERAARGYLAMLGRETTHHYRHCSAAFKHRNFEAPALFVYSRNDPIADPDTIEEVMEMWRAKGQQVRALRFEKSRHVSHLRGDPHAYEQTLDSYLEERLQF